MALVLEKPVEHIKMKPSSNQTMSGTLFIVAAPSGTGKTSLTHALVNSLQDIEISISHTTRVQRPGEQHGVHYWFVNPDEFGTMIEEGMFLEYAKVFDYYYGTSKHWVEERLKSGVDVILEIDWQGAEQVCKLFGNALSIFILPPSLSLLRQRLQFRQQDAEVIIERRLAGVKEEVSHYQSFDYIVINDVFEVALNDLISIVRAHRLLRAKQALKYAPLLAELIGTR